MEMQIATDVHPLKLEFGDHIEIWKVEKVEENGSFWVESTWGLFRSRGKYSENDAITRFGCVFVWEDFEFSCEGSGYIADGFPKDFYLYKAHSCSVSSFQDFTELY